jgi:hypothetical protein
MGFADSTQRPMEIFVDDLVKEWSATYSRQTLEALKNSGQIEAVWHVGDIGYADDAFAHDPAKFLYEDAYNGYMNWLQNLTATMPYMVSVGNHESECHSPVCLLDKPRALALSNFSAYNHRWNMPWQESGGVLGMWYSFNYGPAHFVSVNTETDFPGAGEEHTGDSGIKWLPAGGFGADGQYLAWVEADLQVHRWGWAVFGLPSEGGTCAPSVFSPSFSRSPSALRLSPSSRSHLSLYLPVSLCLALSLCLSLPRFLSLSLSLSYLSVSLATAPLALARPPLAPRRSRSGSRSLALPFPGA